MNAVSCDGEFFALTVTDRILAEPPAFGVALAHSWPSAHPTDAVIEAAQGCRRRARDRERAELHPDQARPRRRPYVVEVAARLGGGHDAELCRAATGVDLNDLALSFALGADPRDKVSQALAAAAAARHGQAGGWVGRASSSSSRRRGCCARRWGSRRPRRSRASSGCGPTGSPGGASGRSVVAPTGPARSWPPGTTPPPPGAGSPCGAGRTLPGRCARLVAPSSASSLPRSGRRRSPPSSRRCARAG